MSADSWFRNATWNESIALQFEAKLQRAKRKEQYVRIQASMLARSHPGVAHALLDRYFEMPDDFDRAQAHVDRANAYLSEGNVGQALASYEAALQREAAFPKLLTQACLDLPYLIAVRGLTSHYARAVEVLEAHRERLMFPVDYFKWSTAQALIAHSVGSTAIAASHAKAALAAAANESSGFHSHPSVGLVSSSLSEVESSLRRLRDT